MSNAKRALGLAIALVSVAVLAAPASAEDPPGFSDPGSGQWVVFTLDSTSPAPISRNPTTWSAVVDIDPRNGLDVGTALAGFWQADEFGNRYWPLSWSASGFTFERTGLEACPAAELTCRYTITSGADTFSVTGGIPILPEVLPEPQVIELDEPGPISWVFNEDLNPQQGVGITLDASGTTDVVPGTLSFDWTVTAQDGEQFFASGPVATVPLLEDGQYTISVVVSNGAYTEQLDVGTFQVTGVQPVGPNPGPGGGGGGSGGGGGGAPAPAPQTPPVQGIPEVVAEPVVFAPPRRSVPAALFGGQNGEAQVVWLWRPEWAGASTGPRSPRTSSPPLVRERADIFVGSDGPAPDSNAGPWLAGLGVFGLFGVGWVLTRRRRVRAEL